ncbi:hypothetical protein Lfu02_26400 [Longispora fulva]|uniref:Uncharacterized protein n=1 Tax=Longispora fulva TaxID=619741 RepID=A0A8J7GL83_9ACTN|nr:hypothetical protein [Longispora fulva]MBG6138773.1 hypothetical protein [Longispora fulva]GIG58268.1 hypothetical protein Lfu02_26400 [Longispora fulva]
MTTSESPWASGDGDIVVPPAPAAAPPQPAHQHLGGLVTFATRPATRTAPPPLPRTDPNKRLLMWFGGGAAGVLLLGIVVMLALVLTGDVNPLQSHAQNGPDRRPPLAKLCPPPTSYPEPSYDAPPVPAGPRTVDEKAAISYKAYGEPWQPWRDSWSAGTLRVQYRIGQDIITERYSEGTYHASILSGSVPATANDGTQLDLKCTGRQVAADARVSYYPQPNTMEMIRDEAAVLGGRPAWVSKFRLHFDASRRGLTAKDELVAIAMIDVGRPEAAVLYISIPGTHKQFDYVVDEVLDSVRYAGR